MDDIAKFDTDLEALHQDLQTCDNKLEISDLSHNQNTKKLSELELELDETIQRVNNAKASKQKEIESIEQKIGSSVQASLNLESQLKETENRITGQRLYISTLQAKLSDSEYASKRKNYFFSIY
jgi:chromosome segregation ATPase